jgi:hypothetical protein
VAHADPVVGVFQVGQAKYIGRTPPFFFLQAFSAPSNSGVAHADPVVGVFQVGQAKYIGSVNTPFLFLAAPNRA